MKGKINNTLNNNDNNGSFFQLLKWYGLTSSVTGNGTGVNTGNYGLSVDFNGNALSGGQIYTASGQVTGAGTGTGFTAAENALVNGKSYNIAGAPLHFVRSGQIYLGDSSLRRSGSENYEWSATASPVFYNNSANLAGYYLAFNIQGVSVADGPYGRRNAHPIRCLAY